MPALPKHTPILFIAPDTSYFAKLATDAKTPVLEDVTQIDAPIIKKNLLDAQALAKVLSSLETKSIHIIIADDIFFHHIGDFPTNDRISLEDHITQAIESAFPEQDEPLHIVTLDLAKTARIQTVQITAMTKDNLQSLSDALHQSGVTAKTIIPASFVVKAFISIDPSLFILETPDAYLLTSHYIGVEHAVSVKNGDLSSLTTEISDLTGKHPHHQHVYLSLTTDSSKKVQDAIEEVLPSQIVDLPKVKTESDTPHVLKALALGYREVIENDFPFPEFELPEPSAPSATHGDQELIVKLPTPTLKTASITEETAIIAQPKPTEDKSEADTKEEETLDDDDEGDITTADTHQAVISNQNKDVENENEDEPVMSKAEATVIAKHAQPVITPVPTSTPPAVVAASIPSSASSVITPKPVTMVSKPILTPVSQTSSATTESHAPATSPLVKAVSLNKKKRNLFSYIILGTVIALIVAVVGGGVIVSRQAMESAPAPTPTPDQQAVVAATPSPTPTPTPLPIAKDDVDILVVNATGKAGYAGATSTKLKEAGYENVSAANARSTYEDAGTFIMIKDATEMVGIDKQIATDAKITLQTIDYDKTENPSERYDVIIVLNE